MREQEVLVQYDTPLVVPKNTKQISLSQNRSSNWVHVTFLIDDNVTDEEREYAERQVYESRFDG